MTLERPIIIYDGKCRFCLKQVARIQARDRDGIFEYIPRQAEGLEARFPTLAQADFNTGMRLIHTDGHITAAADAVYEIARQLPGWRGFAWLYRVPILKSLLRAAYAWTAKNRSRLAGKCDPNTESCKIGSE